MVRYGGEAAEAGELREVDADGEGAGGEHDDDSGLGVLILKDPEAAGDRPVERGADAEQQRGHRPRGEEQHLV